MPKLAVTLRKSPIGYRPEARATVRAIGLHRIHQTVILPDTKAVRGMVDKIPYLLKIEQTEDGSPVQVERRATVAITRQTDVQSAAPKRKSKAKRPSPKVKEPAAQKAEAEAEAPEAEAPKSTRTRRKTAQASRPASETQQAASEEESEAELESSGSPAESPPEPVAEESPE